MWSFTYIQCYKLGRELIYSQTFLLHSNAAWFDLIHPKPESTRTRSVMRCCVAQKSNTAHCPPHPSTINQAIHWASFNQVFCLCELWNFIIAYLRLANWSKTDISQMMFMLFWTWFHRFFLSLIFSVCALPVPLLVTYFNMAVSRLDDKAII